MTDRRRLIRERHSHGGQGKHTSADDASLLVRRSSSVLLPGDGGVPLRDEPWRRSLFACAALALRSRVVLGRNVRVLLVVVTGEEEELQLCDPRGSVQWRRSISECAVFLSTLFFPFHLLAVFFFGVFG